MDVDKSIERERGREEREGEGGKAGEHQMGNRYRCIYVFSKLTGETPAATGSFYLY